MTESTFTWNGGSASADTGNWTLTSGPGNPSDHPQADDTAIIPSGTVIVPLDTNFIGNTIQAGGTLGTIATFIVTGDFLTGFAAPTADDKTLITNAIPGQTKPEATALDTGGVFVNEGTILAVGPTGSVFTINISPSVIAGTLIPGCFYNTNLIQADAGNTLVINIGPDSEVFNSGSIVADGGTIVIVASPSAIAGGYAGVNSFAVIEGGGTLETEASYPLINGSQPGGTSPRYAFVGTTAGNTLKIDNLGSFGGSVIGFQAGDTVDLGTTLAIGTLVYSATTGLLELDNSGGTILGSLFLSTNGMTTSGTFAVTNGSADGLLIGSGADGDTIITTQRTYPETSGVSGSWQSAGSWNNGRVPGLTDTAVIGLGATTTFTLTTGSTSISVNGISIYDPNATVRITSDTTAEPGTASLYAGTLDVTGGNTLTSTTLRTVATTSAVNVNAGGTILVTGRENTNLAAIAGTLDISQGNSGAVQISAGMLVVDGALIAGATGSSDGGSFTIGQDSAGTPATVIVNGDGKAGDGQVTDTYALLGSDPTSSGTLIISGVGADWTDQVDPNDPLNSRGDMIVGYNNLSLNSGTLAPAPPVAAALLVVQNGATLTDSRAFIGDGAECAGSVTVQSGGVWNIGLATGGYLDLADGGQGALSVLAGGTVNVGGTGPYLTGGTTEYAGGIGVGYDLGDVGTITVSGTNSLLSVDDGVAVGRGSQGILNILNGGTVSVATGITAGLSATASGTVVVSGAGSTLLNSGTANSVVIGDAGFGTMTVQDSAFVQSDDNLDVGGTGNGPMGGAGIVSLSDDARLHAMNNLFIWTESTLTVDATSAIDVGRSGTYTTGVVQVESGHFLWGAGLVGAAVVNDGYIRASNVNSGDATSVSTGTLEVSGPLTGSGGISIGPGSACQIDSSLAATQTIEFIDGIASSTLILGAPGAGLNNIITGLAAGDRIEFAGLSISSAVAIGPSAVAVDTSGGNYLLSNVAFASGSPTSFTTGKDSVTGDDYIAVMCFAEGTRIATADDEIAVELLREGDLVQTVIDGRCAPIIWIGHRTVDCTRSRKPESVWPVRVSAGAFGPASPMRDVFLSPDHAVYVNGVLIPVKYLINGTSVTQTKVDRITYYHVELDTHHVLVADGLPAESYLDTGNRSSFANGGLVRLDANLAGDIWEASGCARLIVTGPEITAARVLLAARAHLATSRLEHDLSTAA